MDVSKLNSPRLVGILLLGVVAAILSIDLLQAAAAQPRPSGPDCYPWGAEGPVADRWSYASKTNYLMNGVIQLGLIIGAGVLLLWRTGRGQSLRSGQRAILFAALGAAALLMFV